MGKDRNLSKICKKQEKIMKLIDKTVRQMYNIRTIAVKDWYKP